MSKPVRLDNVAHAALRIAAGHGAAFGDATNQMAIFLPEYEEAQRHYPILFLRQEDGALQSVIILGFDRDENLFLEDGRWQADYVPAMARRGPFLIGRGEDGDPVIHVDLDHPRIAGDGAPAGEALFLPQGGHAPALLRAMDALRALHVGHQSRAAASQLFDELALVAPVAIKVQIDDTHAINFDNHLGITAERIAALDGAALARLNEAGLLLPAVHAASSLANLGRLAARKRARRG